METYLKITFLNDFIFCPLSIYYHQLYGGVSDKLYYEEVQLEGKAAHAAVDEHRYSTHKDLLQGMDVFSEKYQLCGKIDTFDVKKKLLTERKKHIVNIYDGYVFQLYAQYFSLLEMGYDVQTIRFYSMDDNKVHPVKLPSENAEMFQKFESTAEALHKFNPLEFEPQNKQKCEHCIYKHFCDRPLI